MIAGDDQEEIALLVLQKQVLGMTTGNHRRDMFGFLDSENRRVMTGLVRNAQIVQKSEQVFRARRLAADLNF